MLSGGGTWRKSGIVGDPVVTETMEAVGTQPHLFLSLLPGYEVKDLLSCVLPPGTEQQHQGMDWSRRKKSQSGDLFSF